MTEQTKMIGSAPGNRRPRAFGTPNKRAVQFVARICPAGGLWGGYWITTEQGRRWVADLGA